MLALSCALIAGPSANALTLEEEFNGQAKEYEKLFNDGKAADLANLWAEDGGLETSDGSILRGRKAIQAYFQSYFDGNKNKRKLKVEILSLKEPASGTVIEEGTTSNGSSGDGKARYTVVHFKGAEGWKMSWVSERAVSSSLRGIKDIDWLCGKWRSESGKGTPITMQARSIENGHFIECTTLGADGKTDSRQIIGYNPMLGTLVSFHFDSLGGMGRGELRKVNNAWSQVCKGVLPDGSQCYSINTLTPRSKDSITWRSTSRTISGISLPDTDIVVLNRVAE